MKFNWFKLYIIVFLISSCNLFENKPVSAIAKYKSNYLFFEDIEKYMPKNLSEKESLLSLENEIAKWAKNHILIEQANINLDNEKKNYLSGMVKEYSDELFSFHYKEKIVKSLMDTVINQNSIDEYYKQNKINYKLNEDIVKARFIKISNENFEIPNIRNRFRRFNKSDISFLDSISLQFSAYSFNDSIWINKDVFFSKFPKVRDYVKNNIVKKNLFYQLEDSLELYLIKVNQSALRNDIAPKDYLEPTLRQILVNKRKLEFIRNFENELYINAIQTKDLEIYEQ
ncbi:MAG: peptidylprolyl isomerase [Flavobacteriaceae bacterium]|nr:peptidylprolyl isomerase [Flavobacteriaceae bacterium]